MDDVDGFGPGPHPGGVDVRVAGGVDCITLQERAERGELRLRSVERGVKCRLIGMGEGGEVDAAGGCVEGCLLGGELGGRGGEDGEQVRGGEQLVEHVAGVGAAGDKIDAQIGGAEALDVFGAEKFDGDEDLLAGFGVVEQQDVFKLLGAEGDARAVEVDDLGKELVGIDAQVEPDVGAGEVVAVEGAGNLDPAAQPDGVAGELGVGLDGRPTAVVELGPLAVGNVAEVVEPFIGGQGLDAGELVERGLRGRGEPIGLELRVLAAGGERAMEEEQQ